MELTSCQCAEQHIRTCEENPNNWKMDGEAFSSTGWSIVRFRCRSLEEARTWWTVDTAYIIVTDEDGKDHRLFKENS